MIRSVHVDLKELSDHVVGRGSVSAVIVLFAALVFYVTVVTGSRMDNLAGAIMMFIGLFFLATGVRDLIVIPLRLRRVSKLLDKVEPRKMLFKKVALKKVKGLDFPWNTYALDLGMGEGNEDATEQLEVLGTRPVIRPTVFKGKADEHHVESRVDVYIDPGDGKPFAVKGGGGFLFSRALFAFF